ncbi:hypothetical protein GYMLUDRAFT_240776 [Collybiopsis luxurians FD-317 M1]|nr:hypothetical protein GYMLUDRAFT_240776 [Collybiopsis luxurians FD-317 M1]
MSFSDLKAARSTNSYVKSSVNSYQGRKHDSCYKTLHCWALNPESNIAIRDIYPEEEETYNFKCECRLCMSSAEVDPRQAMNCPKKLRGVVSSTDDSLIRCNKCKSIVKSVDAVLDAVKLQFQLKIQFEVVYPPSGFPRLKLAYETLLRAREMLLVGFGEANGGGKDVRELVVRLEREMGMFWQGVRNMLEDAAAAVKRDQGWVVSVEFEEEEKKEWPGEGLRVGVMYDAFSASFDDSCLEWGECVSTLCDETPNECPSCIVLSRSEGDAPDIQ